jgi:hypothetical protein
MSVGDIAMKGAPESIGLAWMGIRMCLSTLSDDFTTFGIFGQASLDIMGIMISCAVFSKMYGPSRNIEALDTKSIHAQVTERIPKVYAAILDFSFSVKKYRNQHRGGRHSRSASPSYRTNESQNDSSEDCFALLPRNSVESSRRFKVTMNR